MHSPIRVDFGSTAGQRSRQALWTAIHNDDLEKISQALRNGSVIEPVHWEFATSYSPIDVVKLLVSGGANVHSSTSSGNTGLHLAALLRPMAGRPEIYSVLVDAGVDVNALNHKGEAALHLLCGRNAPEACMELLRLGADPSLRLNGKTAIELCKTAGLTDNAAGLTDNANAMIAHLQAKRAFEAMEKTLALSHRPI